MHRQSSVELSDRTLEVKTVASESDPAHLVTTVQQDGITLSTTRHELDEDASRDGPRKSARLARALNATHLHALRSVMSREIHIDTSATPTVRPIAPGILCSFTLSAPPSRQELSQLSLSPRWLDAMNLTQQIAAATAHALGETEALSASLCDDRVMAVLRPRGRDAAVCLTDVGRPPSRDLLESTLKGLTCSD